VGKARQQALPASRESMKGKRSLWERRRKPLFAGCEKSCVVWINMKKRTRWPIVMLLWLIFILMIGGIVYLSFQNAEESKELGKQFIRKISGVSQISGAAPREDMDALTYLVRQGGRVLAFLMIGIVGTITIHVTFAGCHWFFKTGLTLFILIGIACFTERMKVYIPTRHYSYDEMMLSVAAAAVGFLMVSIITLLGKALKGISHLLTTSHT